MTVWPAFPHNAELATGDPSLLKFGVELSKDLASQFGVPAPTVLSTRDVPGMPRSSLPILHQAGVRALSEGMNGRMVPVNVMQHASSLSCDSVQLSGPAHFYLDGRSIEYINDHHVALAWLWTAG